MLDFLSLGTRQNHQFRLLDVPELFQMKEQALFLHSLSAWSCPENELEARKLKGCIILKAGFSLFIP